MAAPVICKSNFDFSCVIPVYNEQNCLYDNIKQIICKCNELCIDYELIISDDGSIDYTPSIAKKLQEEYSHIKYLRNDINKGRGEALIRGFKICKGKIIAFMDIDLATDLQYLPILYKAIECGADVATGSRWLKDSCVSREWHRKIISYVYNLTVRLMLDSKIYDHQCGFKAFKREILFTLIEDMEERNDRTWAWDTEILLKSQWKKYKISEFPVKWSQDGRSSKFNALGDIPKVSSYLLKLWARQIFQVRGN